MATDKAKITEPVAQIAARAAVLAMAMAYAGNNQRARNMGPKLMRQTTSDWSSTDKYAELRNFRMEVKNMFQNYNKKRSRKSTHHKELARQARPTTIRNSNLTGIRSM